MRILKLLLDPRLFGARGFFIGSAILLFAHIGMGLISDSFNVEADGPEYLRMAENLLDGRGFTFDGANPVVGKPPGLPFVVALHMKVARSLNGFHLLQLLFLFGGYFAASCLIATKGGHAIGLATLTFLVAMVPLRALASNIMSEPLYILLFSFGMVALVRSLRNRSVLIAAISGILFGSSAYVRPTSLFWPAALLLALWITNRRSLRIGIVVLTAHVLTVGPWIVRNAFEFGQLVPMVSNWGPMYAMTNENLWRRCTVEGWEGGFQDPQFGALIGSEFPYNWPPQERLQKATFNGIRRDPVGWIWRCLKQSANAWTYVPGTKEWKLQRPSLFWAGRASMFVFYFFSVLGAVALFKRDSLLVNIIIAHTIYTAILLFPVTVESRYLLPAYMFLVPLTLIGFERLLIRNVTTAEIL